MVAEQFDRVAGCRLRSRGDVERHEVHGNAADDRHAEISDIGAAAVAEAARPAIGITGRHGGDSGAPCDAVGGTISNGPWWVNVADLQDFSMNCDDVAHAVGPSWKRVDAEQRRPRPHEVEVI